MLRNLLITVVALFGLILAWAAVHAAARRIAARYPEFGPAREGGGCGCGGGRCAGGACEREDEGGTR